MANPASNGIRDRVQAFADELSELLHASVLETVTAAMGGTPLPAMRGRPARASAVSASREKGAKRPPALLAETVEKLFSHIAKNPGQRIEEIGRALGIATKDLTLPARKLIADKRVKTQGEKRATKYFAGGGRAASAAAAPKRAAKKAARKTGKKRAKKARAVKRGAKKSARRAGKKRAAKKAPAAKRKAPAAKKTAKKARAGAGAAKRASKAPPGAAPPAAEKPTETPAATA